MIKKVILASLAVVLLVSFKMPKNLEKKVSKELISFFESETIKKEQIEFSADLQGLLGEEFIKGSLLKITENNTLKGYAYVGNAPSKTATFDYIVIFSEELIISKGKVLIYREEYGGEIGSKRWLKQFIGIKKEQELKFPDDIISISGATISARSMTKAVNSVLKNINTLYQNNIF